MNSNVHIYQPAGLKKSGLYLLVGDAGEFLISLRIPEEYQKEFEAMVKEMRVIAVLPRGHTLRATEQETEQPITWEFEVLSTHSLNQQDVVGPLLDQLNALQKQGWKPAMRLSDNYLLLARPAEDEEAKDG